MSLTDDLQRCQAHILKALVKEQEWRHIESRWEENERQAVAIAANEWAISHDGMIVSVEDVARVEHRAMGHVDYSSKLALYVAELVLGVHRGD